MSKKEPESHCPKCKAISGDDWSQCGESCPMPMSPHYKECAKSEPSKTLKEKKVSASDNWCPNYPGDLVNVSLHKDGKNKYRVAIWGADDMGMEKMFVDYDEALSVYSSLASNINRSGLKKLGFVTA